MRTFQPFSFKKEGAQVWHIFVVWTMVDVAIILLGLLTQVALPFLQPRSARLISWAIRKMFPPESFLREQPVFVNAEAPWQEAELLKQEN